eukprot:s1_g1454.t1
MEVSAWDVCEICGVASRRSDVGPVEEGGITAKGNGYFPKRYTQRSLDALLATENNVLRIDETTFDLPAGRDEGDLLLIEEGFWRRFDAIDRLQHIVTALGTGGRIAFLVPLAETREVCPQDLATLIGDGSLAYRFGWQSFFLLIHGLGIRDIWRHDAEGGKGGLHLVSARVGDLTPRPTLSVVMPVFNEEATIEGTFDRVSGKLSQLEQIDSEIVLVESNSTDGTKEIVESLAARSDQSLKVVWQTTPRGKGHAVREGLERASGDIVLIQDADDEYSVDDYDHLLDALIESRAAFVLGARDTNAWKMRSFGNSSALSMLYNFGHVFFTSVLNVLLGTRFHDPFTMYKVFYRDCLHGLNLRCDRFDFDHELVIKLVRKGFLPSELPASYVSRSHADGKKVSIFKDGLFWITTDLRLRFERLSIRE